MAQLPSGTYFVHAGTLHDFGIGRAMMQRHIELGERAPKRNWKTVIPYLPGIMLILWALIRSF